MHKSDPLEAFSVVIDITVAWSDMDAFAHVNNARYFTYFETARIAYFDAAGIRRDGVGPILASTDCRFRAPVTHPDQLRVGARVTELRDDRFTMEYVLVSQTLGCVAATGHGVVVSYDYTSASKAPMPPAWRRAIAELDGVGPAA